MVDLLITLLIFLIIAGLIWYVLSIIPLPEPFGRAARVVFLVIICLILVIWLLNFLPGGGPTSLRLR